MKDFAKLMKTVHATAVEKGWWKDPPSTETIICLIHTEISEAFEEYRKYGLDPKRFIYYSTSGLVGGKAYERNPAGIAVELADVCIRIMDWCEYNGWELEWPPIYDNRRPGTTKFDAYILFLHRKAGFAARLLTGDISGIPKCERRKPVHQLFWAVSNLCFDYNIPLERAIREKIEFNKTRPYKHGGKRC